MKNCEEIVLKILEEKPLARTDDCILYGLVLKEQGIDLNMTLKDFIINHKKLKTPSFKTIERNRRKICETRQDLINWETAVKRAEEKEAYIEYSRS